LKLSEWQQFSRDTVSELVWSVKEVGRKSLYLVSQQMFETDVSEHRSATLQLNGSSRSKSFVKT